jgi:hypothetical protein
MATQKLQEIEFERMPLSEKWVGTLGKLPFNFIMIIYGKSGHGKTEFLMHLIKELARFGKVQALLYEQGFAADIQDAIKRNDMLRLPINWCDPWDKKDNVSLYDDLIREMSAHKSAKYWVIDSYDATRFNEDQVLEIQKRFEKRKGIIWISHASGNVPDKTPAKKIEYYGQVGILVKNYIATVQKNRFGGFEPYVIWEQRARELNPLFFEMRETPTPSLKERDVKAKKSKNKN